MNTVNTSYNGRSLGSLMAEIKDELKEFLDTRLAMLIKEVREKASAWKSAVPMLILAAVLGVTGFLVFTGFLVAIIVPAFGDNPFGPAIALIIVTVVYLFGAGIAAFAGWRMITQAGLRPDRTIRVLKEDQRWLRNEARSQS